MKKTNILLLTIFTIFISGLFNYSSAQSQYAQFSFGLQGGPSAISTNGDDQVDLNTKSGFGFMAGLFGQYNFNRNYALKLEANYQEKGSNIEINQTIDSASSPYGQGYLSVSGKNHFDYITIPLLFKGTYGDYIKFYFNAGPYLGILLTHHTIIDGGSTYDRTDSTKSTDFGVTAGIGMLIPLGYGSSLTLELRDDIGLTNVNDYATTNPTVKLNAASFVVGFSFGSGKQMGVKRPVNKNINF